MNGLKVSVRAPPKAQTARQSITICCANGRADPAIDIDEIGDCLEDDEGDAERQDHLRPGHIHLHEQRMPVVEEEKED
ncbi:hypothetical protein [Chelatococcus asaccharovorans]|uniref:hypothetical protein n=1 Tax=Chelatococcus asaccharovorans TaxID=28210 RepID=UPI001476565E|nr:hypothetical protein [Chelatococcus asaccharovorans]MBS7706546.1 hypothetical protein [Chelatococcus asaccharovorans]